MPTFTKVCDLWRQEFTAVSQLPEPWICRHHAPTQRFNNYYLCETVYTLGVTGLAFKTPRYAAAVSPDVGKANSGAKEFDLVFGFPDAPNTLAS